MCVKCFMYKLQSDTRKVLQKIFESLTALDVYVKKNNLLKSVKHINEIKCLRFLVNKSKI